MVVVAHAFWFWAQQQRQRRRQSVVNWQWERIRANNFVCPVPSESVVIWICIEYEDPLQGSIRISDWSWCKNSKCSPFGSNRWLAAHVDVGTKSKTWLSNWLGRLQFYYDHLRISLSLNVENAQSTRTTASHNRTRPWHQVLPRESRNLKCD